MERDVSPDGALEALRQRNLLNVVDELRRRGTATRSELGRVTGLSRTTIATLVADLQGRGVIVERERPPDAHTQGTRGRPRSWRSAFRCQSRSRTTRTSALGPSKHSARAAG